MLSSYTKVQFQTNTPKQTNYAVFRSIRLYLQDYKNTSLSKDARLQSLNKCSELVQHIVQDLNTGIIEEERSILYFGFKKILDKVNTAQQDTKTLYDLSDCIGFMLILEDSFINK